jgi:hypothetical protein
MTEIECVYCEVRTESLNTTQVNINCKGLKLHRITFDAKMTGKFLLTARTNVQKTVYLFILIYEGTFGLPYIFN